MQLGFLLGLLGLCPVLVMTKVTQTTCTTSRGQLGNLCKAKAGDEGRTTRDCRGKPGEVFSCPQDKQKGACLIVRPVLKGRKHPNGPLDAKWDVAHAYCGVALEQDNTIVSLWHNRQPLKEADPDVYKEIKDLMEEAVKVEAEAETYANVRRRVKESERRAWTAAYTGPPEERLKRFENHWNSIEAAMMAKELGGGGGGQGPAGKRGPDATGEDGEPERKKAATGGIEQEKTVNLADVLRDPYGSGGAGYWGSSRGA